MQPCSAGLMPIRNALARSGRRLARGQDQADELVHGSKQLRNDRSEERPERREGRKVPHLQQAHGRQEDDEDVTREPGAARGLQLSGRESSESSHDHCRVGDQEQCRDSAAPAPYRWHDFAE